MFSCTCDQSITQINIFLSLLNQLILHSIKTALTLTTLSMLTMTLIMRARAKWNFLLIINISRLIFQIFIFILNWFLITLFWKNIFHMTLSYPVYWTLIFVILFLNYLVLVYLSIFYRRNIIYLLVFFSNNISLFFYLSFSGIYYFCWCILFHNSRLDILLHIHIIRLNFICLYFVLWR